MRFSFDPRKSKRLRENPRRGIGFEEAQEEAREGGFSGAGFADEAEGFSALDGEGDAVDDGRGVFSAVSFPQVARNQQRHVSKTNRVAERLK